jgi:hypothetical protein
MLLARGLERYWVLRDRADGRKASCSKQPAIRGLLWISSQRTNLQDEPPSMMDALIHSAHAWFLP